jgi:hypothetical protein
VKRLRRPKVIINSRSSAVRSIHHVSRAVSADQNSRSVNKGSEHLSKSDMLLPQPITGRLRLGAVPYTASAIHNLACVTR